MAQVVDPHANAWLLDEFAKSASPSPVLPTHGYKPMSMPYSPSRADLLRKAFALLLLGVLAPFAASAAEDADNDEEEKKNLERLAERARQDRSDPAGKVRPDLLQRGKVHAQKMSVAPSIGGPAAPPQPPR
jgi:hypothetical protein